MRCHNSLVIGRYSVLPFYEELDRDLQLVGSRLLNTAEEHRWISNFDYYQELKDFTPETWDESSIHLCQHHGPFVVKGKRSSKKWQWKSRMFARTKQEALKLGERLKERRGDQRTGNRLQAVRAAQNIRSRSKRLAVHERMAILLSRDDALERWLLLVGRRLFSTSDNHRGMLGACPTNCRRRLAIRGVLHA